MFANQSMELTTLTKKPTAGTADAKHAPAASADLLPAVASLTLKDFKIDVQLPLYRIRLPRFNFAASMARSAYAGQPDAKKALPLSRFWEKPNRSQPDTLLESCVQTIAGQLLQDSKQEVHDGIPDELKDLIDQRMEEAGKVLEFERYQSFMDKAIDESNEKSKQQLLQFVSSLRL